MEASISVCRAIRASHHLTWADFADSGQPMAAYRGIAQSSQFLPTALLRTARNGSRFACHFSQIKSISAFLAIDLRVICSTRSLTIP